MEYLALRPDIYCWRNNSGKLTDRAGRLVSFGKVGSADILGIAPDGRLMALEVKKPSTRKNTSPAQKEFLGEISKRGGIAGIVTSIEEVDLLMTFANISEANPQSTTTSA